MFKKIKSKIKSISGWESSYFGGYYRMIVDHPRVFLDDSIEFDPGISKNYLSYYEKEKIIKIFLSKAKKCKLLDVLADGAKTTTEKDFFGNTVNKTTVSQEAINEVLSLLKIHSDTSVIEYVPLFEHYSSFINTSKIYYKEVIKKEPPPSSGKEEKEEKKEEQEQGSSGKQSQPQQKKEEKKDSESGKEEEKKQNSGDSKEQEKQEEKKQDGSGDSNQKEQKEKQEGSGDSNQKKQGSGSGKEEEEEEKEKGNNQESKTAPQNSEEENSEEENKQQEEPTSQAEKAKIAEAKLHIKNIRELMKALHWIKEEPERFKSTISGFSKKVSIKHLEPDTSSVHFTQIETDNSEKLLNMLDISFESTSDIVKNLRIGKLDIAKIAEVPAGNIAVYKQELEDQATRPFSIVILCDESGSMVGSKLHAQYRIVKTMYMCFSQILPQDKIFVYGHTGHDQPELFVYQDPFNLDFERTIGSMVDGTRENQSNYDGIIIEEVYNNVRSFTSDRIIFIVLSDGQPAGPCYGGKADIKKMKQIIEKCKRDEFVTVGIGIQYFTIQGLYQYSTVVNDLSMMPKQVSNLLNSVVKQEFK